MTGRRSNPRLGALWSVCLCASFGCKSEPEAPAPTEPWPARDAAQEPAADAADFRAEARYELATGSIVRVQLPAKEAKPQGTFRSVRGLLTLDLLDLARSKGTLEVDLGSVLMEAGSAQLEQEYTSTALRWMHLGAERPLAELERIRFARFVVGSIENPSSAAAHLGRRLPGSSRGSTDIFDEAFEERRRVTATVLGELEVNGIRIQRKVPVRVDLHYPAPATVGLEPTRITIDSVRPLRVPLAEHEIQPRDAKGRLSSAELELLGQSVGKNAELSFQLVFTRRGDAQTP